MANKQKFSKRALMAAILGDPDWEEPPGNDSGSDDALIAGMWSDDGRTSSYGHIPTIAARLGCSAQTVRNYMTRTTELAADVVAAIALEKKRGEVERADFLHDILGSATKGLLINIKLLDQRAIEFGLRLDKKHFSARTEMTGADGNALYDDDAQRALAELAEELDAMGQDPSEMVVNAVNTLRARLAEIKNKGKHNPHSIERGDADE